MKILVLVSRDQFHPGAAGGDQLIGLLARELAAAGEEVTVLSARAPTLPASEEREGIRFVRPAPARMLAPVVALRLLFGAARGYDLVIEEVIGGERTPFLARVIRRRGVVGVWYQDNVPIFEATYSAPWSTMARGLQSLLLRAYRGGWALTPSRSTARWLASKGLDTGRTAPMFPRVDASQAPSVVPSFQDRKDRFVTIGNFRPHKRFEEAVELLAVVRRSVPAAELVLLGRRGDRGYLERLRATIHRRHLDPYVRLQVDATEEEKFATLCQAKALTIHSPVEGFAWTVPEAGLCGVPALGNPGVPEDTIRDGVNGTIAPLGDVPAYARTLVQWMTERSVWEPLSQGALEVSQEFRAPVLTPEVRRLLERAAGQGV